jgi:hypothetical protein
MENNKESINLLFDKILIKNHTDYELLIDNMTHEQSVGILIEAVEYAYKNGIFSLHESEVIGKSIRVLTK